MVSPKDQDGGVTGTILYDPLQYTILSACTAVAWIFSVELILKAILTVRGRSGVYYWSLLISSAGCTIHALGFVLKFLVGTSWLVDLAFIGIGLRSSFWLESFNLSIPLLWERHADSRLIGWIAMVSGQSFVLWSRLNLVIRSKRILNGVLAAIIINGFVLHTTTLIFIYGANSPSASRWVSRFNIVERVQLVGFSIQESAIGGIYIFATVKLLGAIYYSGTRKAMLQLLAINCICLGMDIILIALEFSNYYVAEASVKPLIYALKLKLEYAVYSQLVGFTRKAFEDGEVIESANTSGDYRGDHQRRQQYNSPADFFRNIPGVLRKPAPLAPYPTLHTHPEQLMKADRAFGLDKVDRELSALQLELSPNNAAAALIASGDRGATVLRRIAELVDRNSQVDPVGPRARQRSRSREYATRSEDSVARSESGIVIKQIHEL